MSILKSLSFKMKGECDSEKNEQKDKETIRLVDFEEAIELVGELCEND